MVNRVDNLLNSEQIWQDFKRDVNSSSRSVNEYLRYQRINPFLGRPPPRLDDKRQVESLQMTVADVIRKKKYYRKKIARVAHHLIASSFYFEKADTPRENEGFYICKGTPIDFSPLFLVLTLKGKIRCRFPNGSQELRDLGFFMQLQQRQNFQPFFQILEKHRETFSINKVILPAIVEGMITHAQFEMPPLDVHVSDKLGPTVIGLGLFDDVTRVEEVVPISGFPRCLVLDTLQRSKQAFTTKV
jgi:hypothetical protein